ncbi:MAG TPA: hypothetical protein VGM96_19420 [Reyranella sp.]|jgi:hypothetical protein
MAVPFEIPDWLLPEPSSAPPPLPPVDDHRVEGLVNGFIAGKQDALFDAPDAYYRQQGRDAVNGAPAIAQRLQDLRGATLDRVRDDGERAALGPRLDAHLSDAMDGIGRHLDAQQQVMQRQIIAERQGLIQRAAALEHDNDDKIAGLAEAHASAAQERARLDGVAPSSDDEAQVLNAARSQILRTAIEQRLANAKGPQALTLYDRVSDALTPADRCALEVPIGATRDNTATDAWLAREADKDGPPLSDRVAGDDRLTDLQRLILQAKIGARESAAESHRVATVKGLDDQLAAATKVIATQPAQYRIGTFNALAQAYDAASEPDKANDTRRLASQESVLRLFAQAGVGAQQRVLRGLRGPERTMAEAIVNHQAEAFAQDSYAAGTALYPNVGPALPADDAEGRLRQERMIEAMRGTPASSDAETTNVQSGAAPASSTNPPDSDRVWTDGESPSQAANPNLVPAADLPEAAASPSNDELHGDAELAQASPKPSSRPATRPPGSSQPGSKPTAPVPAKPVAPQTTPRSRQEQAATNRKEIGRLAGKPASDYPSEESFPENWQARLPQATLDAINREASAFKVPPELLARIMWKESGFNEQAGVKEKYPGQGIAGITEPTGGSQTRSG